MHRLLRRVPEPRLGDPSPSEAGVHADPWVIHVRKCASALLFLLLCFLFMICGNGDYLCLLRLILVIALVWCLVVHTDVLGRSTKKEQCCRLNGCWTCAVKERLSEWRSPRCLTFFFVSGLLVTWASNQNSNFVMCNDGPKSMPLARTPVRRGARSVFLAAKERTLRVCMCVCVHA